VALDLPADAREALVEWRRQLEHPDLRQVAPEALHVTLVFLGHLPEEEIPRIADAIAPPSMERRVLTAKGVKPVPPRRPRLFALDLADEGGPRRAGPGARSRTRSRLSLCTSRRSDRSGPT
jgi:2'-5' RNA ligase